MQTRRDVLGKLQPGVAVEVVREYVPVPQGDEKSEDEQHEYGTDYEAHDAPLH